MYFQIDKICANDFIMPKKKSTRGRRSGLKKITVDDIKVDDIVEEKPENEKKNVVETEEDGAEDTIIDKNSKNIGIQITNVDNIEELKTENVGFEQIPNISCTQPHAENIGKIEAENDSTTPKNVEKNKINVSPPSQKKIKESNPANPNDNENVEKKKIKNSAKKIPENIEKVIIKKNSASIKTTDHPQKKAIDKISKSNVEDIDKKKKNAESSLDAQEIIKSFDIENSKIILTSTDATEMVSNEKTKNNSIPEQKTGTVKEENIIKEVQFSVDISVCDLPKLSSDTKVSENENIAVTSAVAEGNTGSDIEILEEVEEAFIDRESDDEVQYIDEEAAEEKEQELYSLLEGTDNDNSQKADDKDEDSADDKDEDIADDKVEVSKAIDNRRDSKKSSTEQTNFEEISEGSMDPLEQSEIIEAISDTEMLLDNIEEDKGRNRNEDAVENLEQVFLVTQGDSKFIDKENDYISDTSLCGDDDDEKNNLSLEEISDDEIESSKRKAISDNMKKEKSNQDGKPSESVDSKKSENFQSKKRDNEDSLNKENESERPAKKAKINVAETELKPKKRNTSLDSAAFFTNISPSTGRQAVKPEKSQLISNQDKNKQDKADNQDSSKPDYRQASISTQTLSVPKRGKIVQCSIAPLSGSFFNKQKNLQSSKLLDVYKDQLPASILDIFQKVTSMDKPDTGKNKNIQCFFFSLKI